MPRTPALLLASVLAAVCCGARASGLPRRRSPAPAAARAQEKPAPQAAEDDLARGRRLLVEGDAAGAAAALKTAAEARKTDADAWYYYGLALARADKAKDARRAFERAVELRPGDADARTSLSLLLLNLGQKPDAEREAREALALDASRAEAHYVIAALRYGESKFAEAAEEAGTAARLKPDSPDVAGLYARTLFGLYLRESERVAAQYTMPPDADETTRVPVFVQREAALEPVKSRMREAADRLEGFVKSEPRSPSAERWRDLAELLRIYGQTLKAGEPPLVYRQPQVTSKALITFKPEPGFTEEARRNNVTGVVRLRAVLAADGRVRHIVVVRGLPHGLTEMAVAAASKIRFTPAKVDGRPVSQFVILEYNFNL